MFSMFVLGNVMFPCGARKRSSEEDRGETKLAEMEESGHILIVKMEH